MLSLISEPPSVACPPAILAPRRLRCVGPHLCEATLVVEGGTRRGVVPAAMVTRKQRTPVTKPGSLCDLSTPCGPQARVIPRLAWAHARPHAPMSGLTAPSGEPACVESSGNRNGYGSRTVGYISIDGRRTTDAEHARDVELPNFPYRNRPSRSG